MAGMDVEELARRSITGFGEMLAAFGATGVGGAAPLRRPDAIGAVVPWASDNNWIDTAAVPPARGPRRVRPGCRTACGRCPAR